MSLKNKMKDMTPFAMNEKPVKQFPPLAWLLWGASFPADVCSLFKLNTTTAKKGNASFCPQGIAAITSILRRRSLS